jgi:DNA-binding PadR family transcriptional regulator
MVDPAGKRYQLTEADLAKRRGDRRLLALQSLVNAQKQHQATRGKKLEEDRILPSHTPGALAAAWKIHPTSAFRCLERLRKYGFVTRTGMGLKAEYEITPKGVRKLEWFRRWAAFQKEWAERESAAANPKKGKKGRAVENSEDET